MVFLTSLDIIDTGFLTVNNRSNQMTTTDKRVNNGVAMRLKGVEFEIIASSNLDKAVTPGYTPSDIKNHEKRALISINPTIIKLRIVLNSHNESTSNPFGINDVALLKELLRLPETPYWKAIYYPVTLGNYRKRNQQLIYQLGLTDTSEDQGDINIYLAYSNTENTNGYDLTDVKYIPIKFESVTMKQLPTNKLEVTMTGVITG